MAITEERVLIVGSEWQEVVLDPIYFYSIQNTTNVQLEWTYNNTIESGRLFKPGEILENIKQTVYVRAITIPKNCYISIIKSSKYESIFFQRLTDNGTRTGNDNMAVDGSVTPKEFYIQPQEGEVLMLARSMISIQDEKGFDVGTYGGNGLPALTQGMQVIVKQNGVEYDVLGFNIKETGDLATIAYDLTLHDFGNTDDIIVARWTFKKAGRFIKLNGNDGDFFKVIVNDNLSEITSQYIQIQGYIE